MNKRVFLGDGEYDLVESHSPQAANGYYVLKPVKQVKKSNWLLMLDDLNGGTEDISIDSLLLNRTQATSIATALKALIEYAKSPDDPRGGSPATGHVNDLMREARHAYHDN